MTVRAAPALPLFAVFEKLRQQDFALGMDEYQLLLRALDKRYGLNISTYFRLIAKLKQQMPGNDSLLSDFKAMLLGLTRLLWLKPHHSAQTFDECFEEGILIDLQQISSGTGPDDGAANTGTGGTGFTPPPSPLPVPPAIAATQNLPAPGMEDLLVDKDGISEQPVAVRIAAAEHSPENQLKIEEKRRLELESSKFLFSPDYFPIDKRKTRQNLRHLRFLQKGRITSEPDINATIKRLIEQGLFSEVVYQQARVNNAHVMLLIDHLGSMAAFEPFAEFLQKEFQTLFGTVKRQQDDRLASFYFCNCPVDSVYKDKAHTQQRQLDTIVESNRSKQPGIIVISDAGAARGLYQPERIKGTRNFLRKLSDCSTKIAWLNPMPKGRWKGSSAEAIAKMIPMYQADDKGIKSTIELLKGATTNRLSLT